MHEGSVRRQQGRVDPTLILHEFSRSWLSDRPRLCTTCERCGVVMEVGPGVVMHWRRHHPIRAALDDALRAVLHLSERRAKPVHSQRPNDERTNRG